MDPLRMTFRARMALAAALLACATSPLPAETVPAGGRAELEHLRTTLEAAASRADRSHLLAVPRAGRTYYLKGYGAVLILAPRVLPTRRRVVTRTMAAPGGEVADAVAATRRGLEQSLARATTPAARAEIRRSLERLRATEAELRRLSRTRAPRPPVVATAPAEPLDAGDVDLGAFEREMEAHMAAYGAALRGLEAEPQVWGGDEEQQIRRHLRFVEEQAEAFRVEAERARRHVEQEVRTRLAPPPPALALPAPAALPAAPPMAAVPPVPSAPAAPAALPAPPSAHAAPAPTVPAAPPAPPAPAPPAMADAEWPAAPVRWRFWFDLPGEAREVAVEPPDPGPLVAAVREALAESLASYSRPLTSLRPDDLVAVAVDFVPDAVLRARPSRTLIARVRARDLGERRAGRLSAAELRRRIEYDDE
jgi:hypothetical protein